MGQRCWTNEYHVTKCVDPIQFEVPKGETRHVPVPLIEGDPLQSVGVGVQESGNHNWAAYVSITDNQTNDSRIVLDSVAEILTVRR
jgi:hypothetical protein